MFPKDCIQSIMGSSDWWIKSTGTTLSRGTLIFTFVPHVDQIPYTIEPIGRLEPDNHDSARVRVAPLAVDAPLKQSQLPVAAMPLHEKEVWAAYRAKKRPCLVLASTQPAVDRSLTRGTTKHATAPTILVAPYYSVDRDGSRAGYRPEFVERVRHCEYPQFVWDCLPFTGASNESIMRLDHIQPIGAHYKAYKLAGYQLTPGALEVIDELLYWLIWGGVRKDSLIAMYRDEIEATFSH